MKIIKLLLLLLVFTSSLAACQAKEEPQGQQKQQAGQKQQAQGQKKQQVQGKPSESRVYTAHYLEEEVETLTDVEHSIILVRDRDAYVSILRREPVQLNGELKSEIVEVIRAIDPEIRNIHVSDNRDFQIRMREMGRDVERGEPATRLGKAFDESMRRIFPEIRK